MCAQPVSNGIILISKSLFCTSAERYLWLCGLPGLAFTCYSCSAEFLLIFTNGRHQPPFSPCRTCSLSADSRVISGGTLLSPAQCERRGSKSSLWLSNQICAVPGEYRGAERNLKAHYQYFLNRIKRRCGHGVTQGKKRAFPFGFSTENEVRIPLNAASGMCTRVK